jgi:hypothetical protein
MMILKVIILVFLLFSAMSAFLVVSFCVMSSRFHQRQLAQTEPVPCAQVKSNTKPLTESRTL